MNLSIERFVEISRTIRAAEVLEDRRMQRNLAHITYALWFREAKKRPSMQKYLHSLGLDDDFDDMIMGALPSAEEAKQQKPKKDMKVSDDDEWGAATITDLMAEKQRRGR